MARSTKVWDDAANAQLLLAVLREVKLTAAQFNKIAGYLGDDLTANAIKCHIARLRNKVDGPESASNSSPATPAKSTPAKPTKNGCFSTGNTPISGKNPMLRTPPHKRKQAVKNDDTDTETDDNGFEVQATPPPKRIKRASIYKEEAASGYEKLPIIDSV